MSLLILALLFLALVLQLPRVAQTFRPVSRLCFRVEGPGPGVCVFVESLLESIRNWLSPIGRARERVFACVEVTTSQRGRKQWSARESAVCRTSVSHLTVHRMLSR